jgi:hypothetical protein
MMGGEILDGIELQLNFLNGTPIEMKPNIKIYKVSFNEINEKVGYCTYNKIINMICLSEDDVSQLVVNKNIDVYTFLVLYAMQSIKEKENDFNNPNIIMNDNTYFIDELIGVLEIIFKDTVILDEAFGYFHIGKYGFLYQENFQEFQSIIKQRNCLHDIEEEKDNPANDMVRQLLEKRKKNREKLAKAKSKLNGDDENPLTIVDLISIFAEAEHINVEDVFKYDVYQFNNQFNRMKIFKDYDVNIQALLAGAKSDDINLKHWLSKISTNDEE